MNVSDVIAHFKTLAKAAAALKISSPTIIGWRDAGEIPIDRQCQIEIVTDGALKAERDENGMPVKRDARTAPAQDAAA